MQSATSSHVSFIRIILRNCSYICRKFDFIYFFAIRSAVTKTFANEIYMSLRGQKFTGDPKANVRILNGLVSALNITKCTLRELDIDHPGASFHLQYLFQEGGVEFGLCPFYKQWYSGSGRQSRCRFNEGPVQVYCGAERRECSHPSEYDANISMPMKVLKPRR